MYLDEIIGQEIIKKNILKNILSVQVPHSQLFIDNLGYGGLPIALGATLLMLYGKEDLTKNKALGINANKLLENPDIHFIFPGFKPANSKNALLSKDLISEWRDFVSKNMYGSYSDWLIRVNAGDKSGSIPVQEIENLQKQIYLKSYLGGNKICLIWGLDKLNEIASNKLLKLLEEPPEKTYFIMVAEDESKLLPTIISRCQVTHLKPIKEPFIRNYLNRMDAKVIISKNSLGSIRKINDEIKKKDSIDYEKLLIKLLRLAFKAKTDKYVIISLIEWADEMSKIGKEQQKEFLMFSTELFREAFMINYSLEELVNFKSINNFDLKKLAPYINNENFELLFRLFEDSYEYLDRNASRKMLFSDIAIKTTRYLNILKD
jgi:DNA polymerase-3 subunit delta'